MSELLLGDEAVALAALHAGAGGAFSYPGTPATEILEFVQSRAAQYPHVSCNWSANEKVAYEEALGMSLAGRRALVSMKHVGLNVAADPFISSALTGARGGLVLAVADDPGMHSSQNEQDSRYYAALAQVPLFEPSDQQEAYDLTREAFDVSERFGIPVMVRLVTRLAHSRASVATSAARAEAPIAAPFDWRDWTLLPVNARRRFRRLLALQPDLERYAATSRYNRLELCGPRGIIACGIAHNYVQEAIAGDPHWSLLKVSAYPAPSHLVRQMVDHCEEITLVEEGYPFLERQVRGLLGLPGRSVHGKLDESLPQTGELSVDVVRAALMGASPRRDAPAEPVADRPPRLCDGCPHCDTFRALSAAFAPDESPLLLGDIGCYTLAALPPYRAVHSCVDMGASISMALGASKAGVHPVVCTIGDSTFVHSGIPALIGAIHENANMTAVILDNATVAMTGGQEVMVTGPALHRLIRGLGVPEEHVVQIEPLAKFHDKNVAILRREIEYRGLSVVLACRPCIQIRSRASPSRLSNTMAAPAVQAEGRRSGRRASCASTSSWPASADRAFSRRQRPSASSPCDADGM